MSHQRDESDHLSGDQLVEQMQFGLIFVATFTVFVAGAFLTLLLPWTWPKRFRSNGSRWFIGRAWDKAGTFTELAFMG